MTSDLLKNPGNAGSSQRCPKCNNDDYSLETWCNQCGYYAVTGTCVERDDPSVGYYEHGRYVGPVETTEANPLVAIYKAIPDWAWSLMGVVLIVTIGAVLVRMCTVEGSALRIVVVVSMAIAGVVTFASVHVFVGVRNMFDQHDFTLVDIAVSPIRLWFDVCSRLPFSFKHVAIATGGLWTFVVAHLIIGVPYLQLFDFTAPPDDKKQVSPHAAQMMAAAMCAGGSDMSAEEAMEQFEQLAAQAEQLALAGDGEEEKPLTLEEAVAAVLGGDLDAGAEAESADETGRGSSAKSGNEVYATNRAGTEEQVTPEEALTLTLKAAIIGYNVDSNGHISALVVAVSSEAGWRVNSVMSGLAPETASKLKKRLVAVKRNNPFVENEFSATWVEPVYHCSVEIKYLKQEDRFESVQLLELL